MPYIRVSFVKVQSHSFTADEAAVIYIFSFNSVYSVVLLQGGEFVAGVKALEDPVHADAAGGHEKHKGEPQTVIAQEL